MRLADLDIIVTAPCTGMGGSMDIVKLTTDTASRVGANTMPQSGQRLCAPLSQMFFPLFPERIQKTWNACFVMRFHRAYTAS